MIYQIMDNSQYNVYKWLDANEVRDQPPSKPSGLENSMSKKVVQKLFDFLDMI